MRNLIIAVLIACVPAAFYVGVTMQPKQPEQPKPTCQSLFKANKPLNNCTGVVDPLEGVDEMNRRLDKVNRDIDNLLFEMAQDLCKVDPKHELAEVEMHGKIVQCQK